MGRADERGGYTDRYSGPTATELGELDRVLERLVAESQAEVAFLIDTRGQLYAAAGEVDTIDTTALAQQLANGLPRSGADRFEEGISTRFEEGGNVHLQVVGQRTSILTVLYTSLADLGRVRACAKRAKTEIDTIFADLLSRVSDPPEPVTEEDVRALFGDDDEDDDEAE